MSIVGSIIGVVLIVMCVIAIYRVGISEGKHRERMHLIDILAKAPMLDLSKDISTDRRYGIMHVTNYIVNRLKEE